MLLIQNLGTSESNIKVMLTDFNLGLYRKNIFSHYDLFGRILFLI